jgi:hypothetical protein
MTENRKSSPRSQTKDVVSVRVATASLHEPGRRSALLENHLQTPKARSAIPKHSSTFNKLVVRLAIDPTVKSIQYVETLPLLGQRVDVRMLVVERDDGQYAYDLVDERLARDLDLEGLVLLALEENFIKLVEIDRTQVNQQPQLSNCLRIWQNRNYSVADSARIAIEEALSAHGPLPIKKLGQIAGIASPFRAACALIWQGVLAIDISQSLDRDALVARTSDFLDQSVQLAAHARV